MCISRIQSVILYQKIGKFCRARMADARDIVFIFFIFKNSETLKMVSFLKICKYISLLQRTVAKKKIWETIFFNFILGPKYGQNCFLHGQRKTNFVIVFLHF